LAASAQPDATAQLIESIRRLTDRWQSSAMKTDLDKWGKKKAWKTWVDLAGEESSIILGD
jgi:hypothetical protein